MLFTRGGTYFWEAASSVRPSVPRCWRCSGVRLNIIMLLIFLLGLMFFFAITPADVVLFVDGQYKTLQAKREERAAAGLPTTPACLTRSPRRRRRESDRCAAGQQPPAPSGLRRHRGHEPFPEADPARPAAAGRLHAPVTPAVPGTVCRQAAAQTHASFDVDLGPSAGKTPAKKAVSADPLEPVSIGPGGTFGMDPLSNRANSTLRHTQPQSAPAPKEDFELQLQPSSGLPRRCTAPR